MSDLSAVDMCFAPIDYFIHLNINILNKFFRFFLCFFHYFCLPFTLLHTYTPIFCIQCLNKSFINHSIGMHKIASQLIVNYENSHIFPLIVKGATGQIVLLLFHFLPLSFSVRFVLFSLCICMNTTITIIKLTII